MSTSTTLLRAALRGMHLTGAGALAAPYTGGVGVIFTLHRVQPEPPPAFSPNRILTVTPSFLEHVIEHVLDAGYDVVRIDDVPARLASAGNGRPFACFTFDDGYRDNRDHALPIFERYGLPLTIYIASDFADQKGNLWWLALEEAIRRLDVIETGIAGLEPRLPARTRSQKDSAFDAVYWRLRAMPEAETRVRVAQLCRAAGYDPSVLAAELTMSWAELRQLACHPLVTLGAHTVGHWALAKLPADAATREIRDSVTRLSQETGQPCRHFAFPYGDAASAGPREFDLARAAGLRTAVTTRKSLLHARHREQLTGLPRLSLNGDYQDIADLEVLLTGVPFALLDMVERLRRPAVASSG